MNTKSTTKLEPLSTTRHLDRKRLGRRIAEARGELSLSAFGRLIGVAHTTVKRYESGEMLPSADVLLAISLASGKSLDWLVDRPGTLPEYIPSPPRNLPEDEYLTVPLIEGKIAAGEPIIPEEEVTDWVVIHTTPVKKAAGTRDLVACRVEGDSMWPHLSGGDIVVIDRGVDRERIARGRIYAVWIDGGITAKLLQREKQKLFLIPTNPSLAPRVVDLRKEEARIVGIVIGGWRNFASPL